MGGFERLCVRLAREDPDAEHAQSFGIRGQAQAGIDVYIRRKSRLSYIVWQCKRYQRFSAKNIRNAVDKFLNDAQSEPVGSPLKNVDTLVLAVTVDVSDSKLVAEIESQAAVLRAKGIRF